MVDLPDTQRRALAAIAKGPLFRGARATWSRKGTSPVTTNTIDALVSRGLVDRDRTTLGVPMVRITHRGRTALGLPTAAEQIARRSAEWHERIAP